MSDPETLGRQRTAKSRFKPLRRLPWRSGGASALLIAIMSSFDDSLFDLEMLGSSAESADSSSSSDTTSGRRVRAGQRAMPVRENGQPDPSALTDQDYSDIPKP